MRRREFRKDTDAPKANGMFIAPKVQRKLKIGESNDKYEQEADNMANQVVSQTNSDSVQKKGTEEEIQQKPLANQITPFVQRTTAAEEEPVQKATAEDEVQKKNEEEPIQKAEEEEPVQKMEEEEAVQKMSEEEPVQKAELEEPIQKSEEEPVQKKEITGTSGHASPSVENRINQSKGSGKKLEGKTKDDMESGFGSDFSNVNIHTDENAADLSQDLGAKAFTHGNDVYFNKGEYNPETSAGKHLLAHELTHTIQQKGMIQKTEMVHNHLSNSAPLIQTQKEPKTTSEVKSTTTGTQKKESTQAEYEKWKKDNEPKVVAVKSLAEEDAKTQLKTAQSELEARILKRLADINNEIKKLEDFLAPLKKKPTSYTDDLAILKADKLKTKEQIYKDPDQSKRISADRRAKIVKSMDTITATNKAILVANTNWHKYDSQFTGSKELMDILKEIQIDPALLKALVGQESGDLMLGNDQAGDIAGIAQIGATETKAVGHKDEDRKNDKKAVLIAAKVLRLNITNAGIAPSMMGSLDDYKKMALAAYNAGGNAIKQARAATKKNTTWAGLISGDTKSGLYLGLTKTYEAKKVATKFTEVKGYVQNIYERLGK